MQLLRQGSVGEDEIGSILSRFSRLDLNSDGVLSPLECVADAVFQCVDARDPKHPDCVTLGTLKETVRLSADMSHGIIDLLYYFLSFLFVLFHYIV